MLLLLPLASRPEEILPLVECNREHSFSVGCLSAASAPAFRVQSVVVMFGFMLSGGQIDAKQSLESIGAIREAIERAFGMTLPSAPTLNAELEIITSAIYAAADQPRPVPLTNNKPHYPNPLCLSGRHLD
jgi:hypothetical protein